MIHPIKHICVVESLVSSPLLLLVPSLYPLSSRSCVEQILQDEIRYKTLEQPLNIDGGLTLGRLITQRTHVLFLLHTVMAMGQDKN
jgi:hypothetical protein